MDKNKWCELATIKDTHARCVAENIGISRNAIRELVLSGEVPHVRIGYRTRLIHWNRLQEYLYQGTEQPTQAADVQVQKIGVR